MTFTISDRLKAYLETDIEKDEEDALAYWNTHYTLQPDLARFALNMLSIPMMSAIDTQNRLGIDIIEANECLKAWYSCPVKKTKAVDIRKKLTVEIKKNGGIDITRPNV